MVFYVFLISSYTIQTYANFSESSIFKKFASDKHFSDEFLYFSEFTASFSSLANLGVLHGLLYHSAVSICSGCHSFTSAWSFHVRNPRYSLLADEGSAGLRSQGTHGRFDDKETVNAGRKSCAYYVSKEYSRN